MTSWSRTRVAGLTLAIVVVAVATPIYRGMVRPSVAIDPAPVCRGFASAAASVLHLTGIAVERQGAILRHRGGFAIEVTGNCTAWFHAVLYLVGLLVLKAQAQPGRAPGIAAGAFGLAVLAAVNLARLVLLLAVGSRWPGAFEGVHHIAGEGLLAAAVLLLWRSARPSTEREARLARLGRERGNHILRALPER